VTTNQEGVHAAVRAVTGTSRSYNEDWHALFDSDGIASGNFDSRMLAWINTTLGTSYTNVNAAMQAFAVDQGFTNWSSMNTFVAGYPYVNTEAESVVLAFTSEPDDTRKALIDTLVGSLKTAGIWTELDALFVLAAHDSQAALVDWKKPSTRSAVAVNAPTFAADRGYTSDGSTSRLRTNFTPSTNGVKYQLNNASVWYWKRASGVEGGGRRGVGNTWVAPYCSLVAQHTANTIVGSINSNVSATGGTPSGGANTTAGFVGISRASSTTCKFWKNGVQSGSDASDSSTGLPTNEQWICGAYQTSFSLYQNAMAAWGSSLSGNEAAFYSAISAYMTGVGAA